MSRRLPFHRYGEAGSTSIEQLWLPEVGNVTVTLEDQRPLDDDDRPCLVISVDFDLDRIRVITQHGGTVKL